MKPQTKAFADGCSFYHEHGRLPTSDECWDYGLVRELAQEFGMGASNAEANLQLAHQNFMGECARLAGQIRPFWVAVQTSHGADRNAAIERYLAVMATFPSQLRLWCVDVVQPGPRSRYQVDGWDLNSGERFSWHVDTLARPQFVISPLAMLRVRSCDRPSEDDGGSPQNSA